MVDEELDQELYEHWSITVDPGQKSVRVDKFLMNQMPDTSRNRIQKAAEAGFIHADGRPVKSNYRVKPGEVIALMLDRPKRDWKIVPEDIPLDVVHEDDDLMVVNKPAGMVVHPGCGNFSGTLVHALAWHLRHDPRFDPDDPDVGLAHRIDKDTSGLLVIAKTAEAKAGLCRQFFLHTTEREYRALVWGPMAEDSGRIEGNIARDPRDRQSMRVFPAGGEVGKHAVTHWAVAERMGYVTLLRCRLETGRTHQIRVHMSHMRHPLFADERYGGADIVYGERTASYKAFVHNCLTICPRQALHAATLGFTHPITKQRMHFESPMPDDMTQLIEKWRKRQ